MTVWSKEDKHRPEQREYCLSAWDCSLSSEPTVYCWQEHRSGCVHSSLYACTCTHPLKNTHTYTASVVCGMCDINTYFSHCVPGTQSHCYKGIAVSSYFSHLVNKHFNHTILCETFSAPLYNWKYWIRVRNDCLSLSGLLEWRTENKIMCLRVYAGVNYVNTTVKESFFISAAPVIDTYHVAVVDTCLSI